MTKSGHWRGMMYYKVVLVCWLAAHVSCSQFPTLDRLQPQASSEVQEKAVTALIQRLIGSRVDEFVIIVQGNSAVDNKDTFTLQTQDSKLTIRGSSGVAAAWGFHYYTTQFCDTHISWAGNQVKLPSDLPVISTPVTINANDRFRYYQNVCTVSYSFAWWDWARWEREIDWMAMSSINLPLAFNGQEAIWWRVYSQMGFTEKELDVHFGGPAFLAWARMGNLQGWGGPLTASWHEQQVALQHRILDRMREFGMIPVLPGFAGHVPDAITRLYPHVNVSKLGDWGNFNSTYCCTTLLDVADPLFQEIGGAFIREYTREFGTDHVYNADTFNEMTPKSKEPSYLAMAGKAVFDGMLAGDEQAVWLMQGWLFGHNPKFWRRLQAAALLTAVPQGRMIVLDLYSEVSPQYTRLQSYYGQPYIWCMLHNFGGTLPMYGVLERVNKGPFEGRSFANSTMVGTGLTPEGINQNDVMYEFMLENSWRREPRNLTAWMDNYALRRYGNYSLAACAAWQIFKDTVYSCMDGKKHHNKNVFIKRPSKRLSADVGVYNCTSHYSDHGQDVVVVALPRLASPITPNVWYDVEEFYQGWDLMVTASNHLSNRLFRYDLVDVTRQSLQLISTLYYNQLLTCFKAKDMPGTMSNGKKLLDLLTDLDHVLATDEHFLLGRWIDSARSLGTNNMEKDLYEYNARNQITLWGPTGNIRDYANKQWSGLISGYYSGRWKLFIQELVKALSHNTTFNEAQFGTDVFNQVEEPFTFAKNAYPTEPTGDQILVVKEIHAKYRPVTRQYYKFFMTLRKLSFRGRKLPKYPSYRPSNQFLDHTEEKGPEYENEVIKMTLF